MTLQDIKQMEKDIITPAEAAQVVGCDPQLIRLEARERPENLGFPVIIVRIRQGIHQGVFPFGTCVMDTGGRVRSCMIYAVQLDRWITDRSAS